MQTPREEPRKFMIVFELQREQLRPPGAVEEAVFHRLCVHCGKCLAACQHGSIEFEGGFGAGRLLPRIRPERAPCRLCMKCTAACPTGALDPAIDEMHKVHMGRAYILEQCCYNFTGGLMCSTCYDHCPLRGYGMVLKDGLNPHVTEGCAGCGVCLTVCPAKAIEVRPGMNPTPPSAVLPLLPAPPRGEGGSS